MPEPKVEVLRGTLDLLILKAVGWGPKHGYAVAQWIESATNDVLRIEEGTLYPALHRLENKEWVASEWGRSDNNQRAKFYSITAKGRAQLRVETKGWTIYAATVFDALNAPAEPAS